MLGSGGRLSVTPATHSAWAHFNHTTMNFRNLAALPALMVACHATAGGVATERNFWPLVVEREVRASGDARSSQSFEAVGPLAFRQSEAGKSTSVGGIRPLYLERRDARGGISEAFVVYPLLTYRADQDARRWSFLNLINWGFTGPSAPRSTSGETRLDIWPVYFSRQSGEPDSSYRAIFPLAGSIPRRFGHDRISWILFPFYGRFEKRGTTTLTLPWPLIKVLSGDGHAGWEFWPLYGTRGKPGVYQERFALWPLGYDHVTMDAAAVTSRKTGLLPFYARDVADGYRSETFLWPLFGYVDRTIPYRYHARNYLWPLWVHGRGDDRQIDRWAPFYSHSMIKGTKKTWVLWPLWRESSWIDGDLSHHRKQLLYFLYHSDVQRRAEGVAAEAAYKVHFWPLASGWNNGAGRKQWQILSPFEVFFPRNDPVRLSWTPLLALYRFDQTKVGETRHSALWNAASFHRDRAEGAISFHLGPLVTSERDAARGRLAILGGLVSWQRGAPGSPWRMAFGNFRSGTATPSHGPDSLP